MYVHYLSQCSVYVQTPLFTRCNVYIQHCLKEKTLKRNMNRLTVNGCIIKDCGQSL